jgi:hypothetical protein
MKRFPLQSLAVILIFAGIELYKIRGHSDIFKSKDRIRAQAMLPKPVF